MITSQDIVFAKVIRSKEAYKIIDFIKKVHEEFPFKSMLVDNGEEFDNALLKNWCKEKNVELQYSIPYHHASNGRVERVNRTIREQLKCNKGPIRTVLPKTIARYNNIKHRAIGMTPAEAKKIENRETVLKNINEYIKEFKNSKFD